MASQAYDKALQLDSSNASAQTKLAMIRDLMSLSGRRRRPPAGYAVAAAVPAPTVAAPAPATDSCAARGEAADTADRRCHAGPGHRADARPPRPNLPAPAAEPARRGNRPTTAPQPSRPKASRLAEAAQRPACRKPSNMGRRLVEQGRQGLPGPLREGFPDTQGAARSAWEQERTQRINKPGAIQVGVENLRVSVDGDKATAKFRQHYRSATLKTSQNKTLVLVRQDGKWLIQQERVGKLMITRRTTIDHACVR